MYYIYALIDPRTNLPFYIGKGLKKNERHLDHFNESIDKTSNRHKFYKIKYLKSTGLEVPVQILVDDIFNEDTAYQIESLLIKKFGRENIDEGGVLTNICLDNKPPSVKGRKQTAEHIAKRASSYSNTCRTVGRKPHSEETKRKIARPGKLNGFYNKTHSDKVKQDHSNRMVGNKNNSKTYIFTSPAGRDYIVVGEFYKFCNTHKLSIGTMEKQLRTKKIPVAGRCAGWKVTKKEKE